MCQRAANGAHPELAVCRPGHDSIFLSHVPVDPLESRVQLTKVVEFETRPDPGPALEGEIVFVDEAAVVPAGPHETADAAGAAFPEHAPGIVMSDTPQFDS